ncbi:MAG TPA: histidine phosphatase family protein [Propionibacteriaceae bacterium]|nr:histidine phosphatase family protein [Propionibacteriaceae bacterium]
MGQNRTIVHLVRHGEVDNPAGLLYGRLPDYHLSELGREMAERVAEYFRNRDVVHLGSSPLERAQETAAPIAEALGLPVAIDTRLIEAANYFEGLRLSFDGALRSPKNWLYFRNPLRPSWGEAYTDILARMRPAMRDAAVAASGHEAVIVTHQLPIWVARSYAEGRRMAHDPRKRQCTLGSVTSFNYIDAHVTSVSYTEPAAELLRPHQTKKFVAGA